jgi:hypothetical protein
VIHTKEALEAVKRLEADILATTRQSLRDSAELAMQLAKNTQAFKDRTGKLRSSIIRVERSEWEQTVKAGGSQARYALFVEEGTHPHEIAARRREWLRFEQNGQVRFAKRVHHPGTKPTNFMLSARDKAEERLTTWVSNGITNAIG